MWITPEATPVVIVVSANDLPKIVHVTKPWTKGKKVRGEFENLG